MVLFFGFNSNFHILKLERLIESIFSKEKQNELLINIIDYFLWSLQRKIERDGDRYFVFLSNQVNSITYLYHEEQA